MLGTPDASFHYVLVDQRLPGAAYRICETPEASREYLAEITAWERARLENPKPIWLELPEGARALHVGDWWALVEPVGTLFSGADESLIEHTEWSVSVYDGRAEIFDSGKVPGGILGPELGQAIAETLLKAHGVDITLGYLHGIACSLAVHDRIKEGADISALVGRPVAGTSKTEILIDPRMEGAEIEAYEVLEDWEQRCAQYFAWQEQNPESAGA